MKRENQETGEDIGNGNFRKREEEIKKEEGDVECFAQKKRGKSRKPERRSLIRKNRSWFEGLKLLVGKTVP